MSRSLFRDNSGYKKAMVKVQKADGSFEEYSEDKVRTSLARAGADAKTITRITEHINTKLFEGISSQDIYALIYNELKRQNHMLVSRYNLKRAIMQLGPSGYPFERFVAGVLASQGYTTEVSQLVPGECVYHEVDVVAQKDGKRAMIECKFHNHPGTKSKIQTILYTYARFMDVSMHNEFHDAWLVTNTKVTKEVIEYAKCKGLTVIAWDYPNHMSLRKMIEDSNLHPITALDHLSHERKRKLLDEGVVFVKDLKDNQM
ncbi:restriction endonuclease [Candidatus Roizmanbacteria bacterium]|nr:restriction endonuclease [Candidatus Roizmanbacteria bacterium]